MLLTASYLLYLLVLVTSLHIEEGHDAGLFSRAAFRLVSGSFDSIGHLSPREAQPYADAFLDGSINGVHLSRRHAESEPSTDSTYEFTQILARRAARRPPVKAGSPLKASISDKKVTNNKANPGKPATGKGSVEEDKAVKATATTLKEKYNWPPPNYGSMTPQERRTAASKARSRQNNENSAYVRNAIAKYEGSGGMDSTSIKAGSKASRKEAGSPPLPVSSETSSRSAFGPLSKSSSDFQSAGSGTLSRQSSRKSSGVLVNTPDLLSPAGSGVSGGWTLLDE